MKPLLSIITSIYNGGKALREFLNCISNQTYDNIEVIIIEDCSTDKETLQIVNKLESGKLKFNKPFKLIKNTKNLGLFDSFQKGLDNATGEYFAFPESDDLLDLDFYEILMTEIINKKADVVKGLLLNIYEDRRFKFIDQFKENPKPTEKIINLFDNVALPIAIKNSTGQIISYLMPDITYSWFYVFNRKILMENSEKPLFNNAILYGFSKSPFDLKYKEAVISVDKASFYYYRSHNEFEDGDIKVAIIEDDKENTFKHINTLKSEQNLLEKMLSNYKRVINILENPKK